MPAEQTLQITLMLPGMAAFSSAQWQDINLQLPVLPGLSDLLNRLRRAPRGASSFESMVAENFGFPAGGPLPIAALTYWHDKGRAPVKPVLRADPVYLKADRDCVLLLARNLQVSLEEAGRLADQVNRLYADSNWSLEIGTSDRWYICSEEGFDITTHSIAEAFGRNIEPYLPGGNAGKKWRAVLNELQMLLHNSEINLDREMRGRLPVNSVWLWGEGSLPARTAKLRTGIDHVWSNEPFSSGMAHWARCAHDSPPSCANEWLQGLTTGRHLLVFDDLRTLAQEDFRSWERHLTQLDEVWLAPVRDFIKNKPVHLQIQTGGGAVFNSNGSFFNKWRLKKRQWYEWFQ